MTYDLVFRYSSVHTIYRLFGYIYNLINVLTQERYKFDFYGDLLGNKGRFSSLEGLMI